MIYKWTGKADDNIPGIHFTMEHLEMNLSLRYISEKHDRQTASNILWAAIRGAIQDGCGDSASVERCPAYLLWAADFSIRGFVIRVTKEDVAFDRGESVLNRARETGEFYACKYDKPLRLVLIEGSINAEFESDLLWRFKITKMPTQSEKANADRFSVNATVATEVGSSRHETWRDRPPLL